VTILALETSTQRGSIAVWSHGRVIYEQAFQAERGHSAQIFGSLEAACVFCEPCDRIAVGLGPGSYSGVRIAISSAIGLSMALNAELVGLVSAAALETEHTHYAMIGDARRGSFYFAEVRDGECIHGPVLLTADELTARLSECALPVFSDAPIEEFPQADLAFPSATKLAQLAAEDRGIIQRDLLEPLYLRDPHITQPKPKS